MDYRPHGDGRRLCLRCGTTFGNQVQPVLPPPRVRTASEWLLELALEGRLAFWEAAAINAAVLREIREAEQDVEFYPHWGEEVEETEWIEPLTFEEKAGVMEVLRHYAQKPGEAGRLARTWLGLLGCATAAYPAVIEL